jgi:hypothetical protein
VTRFISYAIVRTNPPEVFVAEDIETLQWVLGIHLVAQTPANQLEEGLRDALREALREEQWGDAVSAWMDHEKTEVDVYSMMHCWEPEDIALGSSELQFTPLFED